ncbi:MAG: hypothetical protein ACFFCO_04260 [Promethearchaeota archaeon]
MTKPISLKAVERKAYLSYHKDGLVDICLGLALLTSFIGFIVVALYPTIFADVFWIIMTAPISVIWIWPFIYMGAKKSITIPRLGYAEFSPKRTKKTRGIIALFFIINFVSLFVGFYALVSREFTLFLVAHFLVILGLVGLLLFGLVAYLSDFQRFYVYGGLTAITFILSYYLNIAFYIPILSLGTVLLVAGIVLLVQFLRQYPKVEIGDVAE